MKPTSLLKQGTYARNWVKDFYEQTAVWWGPDAQEQAINEAHAQMVERFCGPGIKRILDVGTGSGRTATAMADLGHTVIGIDLCPRAVQYAQELVRMPRKGSLTVLEADYYTVELEGCFDLICCWEGFGIGSDSDQRRLLKRMAQEWLAPDGRVLMDIYSPVRPARHAGSEVRLAPLRGVPGSVEMINRCHFDPVQCRWIDEWEPTQDREAALAQSVRCYTPADFLLLLEATGLTLNRLEVDGEVLNMGANKITRSGALMEAYYYLVELVLDLVHCLV